MTVQMGNVASSMLTEAIGLCIGLETLETCMVYFKRLFGCF